MEKNWLKSYKDGGAISPEDAAIAKVLMERNRGKNFVDRAFNDKTAPKLQTNKIPGYENMPNGQYSTELMAYDVNQDGTGRVYPEIVQKPGDTGLTYLGGDKAWDYADSTGQYITTPNAKIADMLSNKGYKKATGIPTYEGGGVMPVTDDERTQFNAVQAKAYQQDIYNNPAIDHDQSIGNNFLKQNGFDPSRLGAILSDMNGMSSDRVKSAPDGMSQNDWYGHKFAQQSYTRYEVDDNGVTTNYGTNKNNALAALAPKPISGGNTDEWKGFGDPTQDVNYKAPEQFAENTDSKKRDLMFPTLDQAKSNARTQKSNWHTDEDSDYGRYGIRIQNNWLDNYK